MGDAGIDESPRLAHGQTVLLSKVHCTGTGSRRAVDDVEGRGVEVEDVGE